MKKTYEHIVIPIIALIIGIMVFGGVSIYNFLMPTSVYAVDEQIVEIQTRLSQWGYYVGDITGLLD